MASVLVTGSSGGVGKAVCAALLKAGHEVVGFDRIETQGISQAIVGDILDREAINRAVSGIDAIIHLAATPDEADFIDELLEPNVSGLYHICDAAQQQGVPRLILTSSVQVVTGHSWKELIRVADGPKVINHYALTKLWAEDIGEMYSRMHSLTVIAARLGWLPRSIDHARELAASGIGPDLYLSHTDAGRFFCACVDADLAPGRFEILFATSNPVRKQRVDLEPARSIVGFEPQDTWPSGQPFL